MQASERGGEPRYRLLETVRRYAAERLAEAAEREAVHAAHAAHYLALAGAAHPDQVAWLDRLELEHDNLRAALRRLLDGSPEDGGRLAGLLWPFWYRRGHYSEARVWLERAAGLADRMSPPVRVGVLTGAGVRRSCSATTRRRRRGWWPRWRCTTSWATGRGRGRAPAARLDRPRAGALRRRPQPAPAQPLGLARARRRGGDGRVARLPGLRGVAGGRRGAAAALGAEALATLRPTGRAPAIASVLVSLGAAALYASDLLEAERRLDEALALARGAGYAEGIAWSLNQLAIVARRRRDHARAAGMLRESLALHDGLGDRWRVASVLEEIAGGLLAELEPEGAAELLGATAGLRDALGTPVPFVERPDHEAAERALRRRLGAAAMQAALAAGRARPVRDAIAAAGAALDRCYPAGAPAPRAPLDGLLTQREQAVLALLSEGATNREIGAALYISPSTAGVHVSNILRKLGVEGRVQAAASAHRLGLVTSRGDGE